MSNSTTLIDQISSTQATKEVLVNANFDAASPAMIWGRHASATSGLTWGYYGGCFYTSTSGAQSFSNGTVTLTASTTNYVYANATTGAVGVATTGFPAGAIPLYSVVTNASGVTSYTDVRSYAPSALATGTAYDVGGYLEKQVLGNESAWGFCSPRSWTLPAGASGAAVANVAATAAYTLTLNYNGSAVGTISWAAGATVGTVAITSAVAVSAGGMFTLTGQATPDSTLAGIAFTFAGTRP
ncbi:hypothetical protein [Paraburkholderia tuberum]|uniref:Uncharacterized protein n=1 Tax=Paraburkholderia tuberum TaxID=157910 RepID=A0A1H1JAK3_9BURK|nr:hypothetical protein [Paraburkholderia tuberum]SDR47027.1 hypothetical protein SAMN05445850_4498 [Paraburkholderia tuberum]